jgi:sortase (surface protein transpeptidase)
MIVSNFQLVNSIETLNYLMTQKIDITASFQLLLITEKINDRLKVFEQCKKIIFDKYIVKDEKGQVVNAKDEQGNVLKDKVLFNNSEEFQKEYNELLAVEVEIEIPKIDKKHLSNVVIEPIRLNTILWLIV